ncbi:divergent polysaccharide deacetylase family protein [Thalassotalea sediminis]|uniref:divergent polysaccharide deacetylase family protein n=1 Tax=Thalassotalea sediminis TaxID=1759089 RepID=UPI002573DDCC|nr:divergent polysaccharide deacetylase family protein [Thalassotalea sediminis]
MIKHLCLLFLISFTCHSIAQHAKVAIIIDDIGYRKTDIQTLELPGNITYAVLPHTPFGKHIAQLAFQAKNDVIIHVPMESTSGKKLGPGGLTAQMDETEIRHALTLALEEIPFAVGINNHMGSKLTTLYSPMAWTMRFLKEKDLIFIDSVTTRNSKARRLAKQFSVPNLSRRVFLDNQLDQAYIKQQFDELIYHAKRNKSVVAIAHPHPETIKALKSFIPELKKHNIDLVKISALLPKKPRLVTQMIAEEE